MRIMIFFVNFWVIILYPVFLIKNLKKLKNLKHFSKKALGFSSPDYVTLRK